MNSRQEHAWNSFKTVVKELGGEVLEANWLGSRSPHRIICKRGHDITAIPGNTRRILCRICPAPHAERAWLEFQECIKDLNAQIIETQWLGNQTPHRVKCEKGHIFTTIPQHVRGGNKICVICTRLEKVTSEAAWEKFKDRVQSQGGEVLECNWLGIKIPHRVRCKFGHINSPTPDHVNYGKGICRTCVGQDPVEAEKRFLGILHDKGATPHYDIWRGSQSHYEIECANGHLCYPRASSILEGQGICRFCAHKICDGFYVVCDNKNTKVKFGITSNMRVRLKTHDRAGYEKVVFTYSGLKGNLALEIEEAIRSELKKARLTPIRGREYFAIDSLSIITGLIESYFCGK